MINPTQQPSFTRFDITSKKDSNTGAYKIEDYDRDIAKFERAITSALPKGVEFFEDEKEISKQGRLLKSYFVSSDYASIINKVLKSVMGELSYKGGDIKYKLTRRRKLSDDEAFLLDDTDDTDDTDPGKQRRKNRESNSLFTKGMWLKIIALVTSVLDVTRRILSSVLGIAVQTTKDMTQAHNLGVSYEAVRQARYTEIAHGLEQGAITNAMAEVLAKFGNVTKLDEGALKDLAVVMGSEVEDLVKAGLGSSDPEKLLGKILDKFNEQANAGYNSIGQYVGEQQARRELYGYLLKISPVWANIFATMQEEQHNINSIFRNMVATFEKFKEAVPLNRTFGNTEIERGINFTLGQEWALVKADVAQIKDNLLSKLAPVLLSILRGIENLRFGLSESQNRQLNLVHKAENQAEINRVNQLLAVIEQSGMPQNQAERDYVTALKQYVDALTKENESSGNIANLVRTENELRYMGEQIAMDRIKGSVASDYLRKQGISVLPAQAIEALNITSGDVREVIEAYNYDVEARKRRYIMEHSSGKNYIELISKSLEAKGGNILLVSYLTDSKVKEEQKLKALISADYLTEKGKLTKEGQDLIKTYFPSTDEQLSDDFWLSLILEPSTLKEGYDSNFILSKIVNKRIEQAYREAEGNNSLFGLSFAVPEINKMASNLPVGTYPLKSENIKLTSGESAVRLFINMSDEKGNRFEKEVYTIPGVTAPTEEVINITKHANGELSYSSIDKTASMGTSASGGM